MLKSKGSNLFLAWVISSMIYLAVVTLAGVLVSHSFSNKWEKTVHNIVTVQVPDPQSSSGNSSGASRLDSVLRIVKLIPEIEKITVLEDQNISALFERWMTLSEAKNIMFPKLIELKFFKISNLDLLRQKIGDAAPGSWVDDHGGWKASFSLVNNTVTSAGWVIFILAISVSIISIIFAVSTTLSSNKEIISLVHLIGGSRAYITKVFQKQILKISVPASLIGTFMAIGTLDFIQRYFAQPFSVIFPNTGSFVLDLWGMWEWLLVISLPFIFILLCLVTVQISTMALLRNSKGV